MEIGRKRMLGSDGRSYTVIELEERIAVRTKDGTDYIPGMRSLQLEDGREVYSLDNKLTVRGSAGLTLAELREQ